MKENLRCRLLLILGLLISRIPFAWLICLNRGVAFFMTPCSRIAERCRKIPIPVSDPWKLRYKHAVAKQERFLLRYRKTFPAIQGGKDLTIVENRHYFDFCLQQKRGVIFISVHQYYNFLLFFWLNRHNPQTTPYFIKKFFPERAAHVHGFLHQKILAIFNGRVILASKDMRKTVELLKEGKSILVFQDSLLEEMAPHQFLGRPFKNVLGSVRLAEITHALLLPVMATNNVGKDASQGKWKIHFWKPIDPKEGGTKEKVLSSLEEMVSTYPESWERWDLLLK
jgi:lauroyl/myristoyl acyltransferase